MNFLYFLSGPLQGLKVRGARSTVVGIVCPPGLNVLLCSFRSVYYFKVQMLQSTFLHVRSLFKTSLISLLNNGAKKNRLSYFKKPCIQPLEKFYILTFFGDCSSVKLVGASDCVNKKSLHRVISVHGDFSSIKI